jgi:hypothetical protein
MRSESSRAETQDWSENAVETIRGNRARFQNQPKKIVNCELQCVAAAPETVDCDKLIYAVRKSNN